MAPLPAFQLPAFMFAQPAPAPAPPRDTVADLFGASDAPPPPPPAPPARRPLAMQVPKMKVH